MTARKRYVRALIEFHELLQVSDPMRQWGGLRRVQLDNGETCFLCNRHASQACGVVDLSWQASETSLTSGQLMARRAWKYKNPDFRFSRSLYNPRRGDPGPTEAEIIAAERAVRINCSLCSHRISIHLPFSHRISEREERSPATPLIAYAPVCCIAGACEKDACNGRASRGTERNGARSSD